MCSQDCFQRTEVQESAKREVIGQKCMSNTDLRCLFFVRDARSVQGVVDGGMGGGMTKPQKVCLDVLYASGEKRHTRVRTHLFFTQGHSILRLSTEAANAQKQPCFTVSF